MENRPTLNVATPSGTKVEIKTYMTARESNALRQEIWGKLNLNIQDGKVADTIPGSVLYEQERKTLEIMIVSVNGSTEQILDRIDDLPQDDYQFILAEVNKASRLNFNQTK